MVTDNDSNVKNAFYFSELVIEGDSDNEDGDIEEEGDVEDEGRDTDEEGDDFVDSSEGDNVDEKLSLSQRVSCFAHALQLCVKR